ncbi:MAG: hypothetical protein IJO29_01880 [Oscillospiraceae bacterium]|nr:hypothetical protein [Oscillospiraceae bacterium]
MAGLISEVLAQVYTAVSEGSQAFDWSFNDTQVEGRNDDIFYILSCEEIEMSDEVYHSASTRRRFGTIKIKCNIFANPDINPSTLGDSFQSQICDKLFESSLEIAKVSCTNSSFNKDYDRLEMCAYISARFLYIY